MTLGTINHPQNFGEKGGEYQPEAHVRGNMELDSNEARGGGAEISEGCEPAETSILNIENLKCELKSGPYQIAYPRLKALLSENNVDVSENATHMAIGGCLKLSDLDSRYDEAVNANHGPSNNDLRNRDSTPLYVDDQLRSSPQAAQLAEFEDPPRSGEPWGYSGQREAMSFERRQLKGSRKRKQTQGGAEKPKIPTLTKPLSELTKDYHHLPFRDMESWVHRSVEIRRKEVEKRGGYVTRPMNSFMLYRSAYAERTKYWCLQNNHQVVSSVSGMSWPLEPARVREKYNELAKIERSNHQAAHPGYKFSPSKVQVSRKRKATKSDDESVAETTSEADVNISPKGRSLHGARENRPHAEKKKGNVCDRPPFIYIGYPYEKLDGGPIRSSFSHNNPGKTPPVCMETGDMSGQYYQTTVRPSASAPMPNPMPSAVVEDITIRKTSIPRSLKSATATAKAKDSSYRGDEPTGDAVHNDFNVDPALLGGPQHPNPETECQPADCGLDNGETFFEGPDPIFPDLGYGKLKTAAYYAEPLIHCDNSLLESGIDLHKLPGYTQRMEGYLDNQEPWTIKDDISLQDDDKLYDDWLE